MNAEAIELAPANEFAAGALEPWFAVAWADMWGAEPVEESETAKGWLAQAEDRERWVATLGGEPVGIAETASDDRILTISALAVARSRRNVGIGAEIVALLERRSRAERSEARFPLPNGYAFYFWLRSGYRPRFAAPGRSPFNAVWRALR